MIKIIISDEMKQACPNVVLGCIQAKVNVGKSDDKLVSALCERVGSVKQAWVLDDVASIAEIKASREAYKKLGKSPSRYRVSSEALFRRILSDKSLYFVNNVVDINNVISLKSRHSVGSYNIQNIEGDITFSVAEDGAEYQGIGKGTLNIEKLPTLKDDRGYFGSPTSDSQRAMVSEDVQEIIMCIYGFAGSEGMEATIEYAVDMLREHADAKDIETEMIFA
ncbi:B3/B4 domain-containing protein [Fusibacter ferrireducens]|uniref:B3/B4 tRNA-binding domain-containing protein n=1 Tax=Fusibacter ferrireducens TaxID=2785058 RepID=A0ABR9ZYR0_9FIRM|nr:phenylalanine--tRNA ligase beta subunit-related protein [Fusibacter ferrireducens]MBF4695025.1 hypothetical protein [Fusibacter ferrireducens]